MPSSSLGTAGIARSTDCARATPDAGRAAAARRTSHVPPRAAACRCACSSTTRWPRWRRAPPSTPRTSARRRTSASAARASSSSGEGRLPAARAGDDGACATGGGLRGRQPPRGGDAAARGAREPARIAQSPARPRPARRPHRVSAGGGALVGPELFQAAADLRSDRERADRWCWRRIVSSGLAVWPSSIGSVLCLAGVIEPIDLLLGIGGP